LEERNGDERLPGQAGHDYLKRLERELADIPTTSGTSVVETVVAIGVATFAVVGPFCTLIYLARRMRRAPA
jgi:hypothetical protein